MEIVHRNIEGKSIQYYALIAALAVVALAGLNTFLLQYEEGHYKTGMSNQVPWGLPIVMVIFMIGASAGSLILSSLATVFGREEYKVFSRVSVYLAALLLIGALMLIGLDIGRPERALYLFKYFNFSSIFAINAFLYSSYILICLVYLWAMFEEKKRLVTALGVLAVFWAVAVHSGTGAIFGFIYSRELYHSALMPPSFLVAALVSGTALVIVTLLATFRFTKRAIDDRLVAAMGKLLAVFILVQLYFVVVENATRAYSPEAREALNFLLYAAPYSQIFLLGQILIGAVIPLLILFYPRTGKSALWITIASLLAVAGILFERYIIVISGLVYPQIYFPGKEASSIAFDGAIGSYAVSSAEITLVSGVVAILGVLYAVGLKIFDLLPLEAKIEEKVVEAPPQPKAEAPAPAKESECELCGAKFKSMDECCEHAEKEHKIAKASCDMCCKEV